MHTRLVAKSDDNSKLSIYMYRTKLERQNNELIIDFQSADRLCRGSAWSVQNLKVWYFLK